MASGILFRLKGIFNPVAIIAISALLYVNQAQATHLVGGSMTYRYLGKSSKPGLYNYFIHIEMYRDCSNNNNVQFSGSIVPGVYERKVDTPNVNYYSRSGDTTNIQINKIKEFTVSPPAAAKSCAFAPSTCIREGVYEAIIGLPASIYGYYLFFQTCCRNTMVNVPGVTAGQNYFAIIPPTSIVNSTPEFNAVPSPYICADDTVSLLYAASEPDGDSLVYTLAVPYGGGGSGAGIITPGTWPLNMSPYTMPVIPYSAGYSVVNPFGSQGYVSLDKHAGILTMYAKLLGRYALAVDVHEYRKGKQISVTRRDVQIIVIHCPVRNAPRRVPISDSLSIDNSTKNIYNIEAGERIAFNLRYKADSAGISQFSETGFFDKPNNLIHQPILKYAINGEYVTAYFSWQTTCKDASVSPYNFTITAADTGCPPKTNYQGIEIYVDPFKGIKNIYGPNPTCPGLFANLYSAIQPPKGDTLIWKVIGGTYINSPNDSSISVNWPNSGTGSIQAVMHSQYGCGEDTLTKNIIITAKPSPPVIIGPKNPCANFTTIYNAISPNGKTYFWKVKGGTITGTSNQTGTISVKWPTADSTARVMVYEKDTLGCYSDTAILNIIVAPLLVDSIYGSLSVCPNSKGIDYWVAPQAGATYNWYVFGGRQVSGNHGAHITIDWGSQGGGMIQLNEVTSQGCRGDTLTLIVKKDYVLYTSAIKGDTSTCTNTKNVPYSVTKNTGSTYKWQISGGSIASGNGTASILVDWDSAGPGALMVTETAYDSVNKKPCTGIPVSLAVNIHTHPAISPLSGPSVICEYDIVKYSVMGDSASRFLWKINNIVNQNNSSTLLVRDTAMANPTDTLHISAVKIAANGCKSMEDDTILVVYKIPVTGEIIGPRIVCAPDLKNIAYQVTGFPASTFIWTVDGGDIVSGDKTDKILVNWNKAGTRGLQVQEINQNGCSGPPKKLFVKVDSLTLNIQYVSTEESNDRVIDIFWIPSNNEFFDGYYKVFREREGQSYFSLIDSLKENNSGFTDKNVNTALNDYSYKIVAENSCGIPVSSNIHRSIRLTAMFDGDTTIHLNWTPYQGWPVKTYDVNTGLNEDTLKVYGLSSDTSYPVIKTLDGYRQCMRIKAKESAPDDFVSLSNQVCINFDPVVWIPDIFTPHNGDHINNTFHIFVENYSSFALDIYNRWGEHVFSSNNPSLQWDGTYKGTDCAEGVYLYKLTVRGVKDYIYRSGTVEIER